MPITINPICRKPRIHVKLKNSYLRKLNKELLNKEKDNIEQQLLKAKEANVILCGEHKETEKIINLNILNRINIRKSLPIFLNI